MSFLHAVCDYVTTIINNWLGYVGTGSFLLFVLVPKTLGEGHKVAAYLRLLDQNRRFFLYLCLACFVCSNFQAFYDARTQAQANLTACQVSPAALAQVMKELPTSLKGLKPGDPWNDGGIFATAQP